MKIKGAELRRFMDEAWPSDDWYWDHDLFDDDPVEDEVYDTDEIGPLMYQGKDPEIGYDLDLGSLIRKWRKTRTYDIVTVLVPKDRRKEFDVILANYRFKMG